jgi:hypothetical protein
MTRDAESKTDPKLARLFDKRTVDRNIKKGLISRKDYDKFLKSLDDVGDKGNYGVGEEPEAASAEGQPDSDAAGAADDSANGA